MNDKERILMEVLNRLAITQVLARGREREADYIDKDGSVYVHFACWDSRPIEKGDLVLAETGMVSDFKIGWVHQVVDSSTCVIREIGSNRLCNYGNEKFTRIVGMYPSSLLEGQEYLFEKKVKQAFGKGDKYVYRFGGVDFNGKEATIWIREVFGGMITGKRSIPFSVTMKWNAKTSVKHILETMLEAGYGTKKFDYEDAER